MKAKITFKILSFWHAGSGSGEGSHLDAVVTKTPAGLPCIPGRTVKGLFRESVLTAEECGMYNENGMTDRLFGKGDSSISRFDTVPGLLRFTGADLGEGMEQWAGSRENRGRVQHLYSVFSSTKINENGLAADKSLRSIELTVPLKLCGFVQSDDESTEWMYALRTAAPLLRHLGSHRHRGLGRVVVTVEEVRS